MFGVTILGNNSALPAYDRHPTAQVITLNEQLFLIDCGEGTQMQLSKFKVRRGRINHIFISHLHGDHYFGLPGLVTSMGLMGRENELHIYAPAQLQPIIQMQLDVSGSVLPYALHFHALGDNGVLVDNSKFTIHSFRVNHRIDCWGFIIREKKKPRRIDKEKAIAHEIPLVYYERLKNGDDYETKSGEIIKNEWVTIPNTPGKSYAYCADTVFTPSIAEEVKNVSLLYHETTYLKQLTERAAERFHSTTEQAAEIARLANAQQLLIGHFSSKYEVLDEFLSETSAVFPNTSLAMEGVTYLVP